MRADREAVLERLSALVQRGADVLGTGDRFQVDVGPFQGWRAQAISTLTRTLGPGDTYLVAFEKAASDTYRESLQGGIAILESLRDDVASGHLARYSDLVSAAVFDDFLDMAEHLVSEGYKDPAASLSGAVLEDGLRRIAANASIPTTKSDGLDSLNKACFEAAVYSALTRSNVNSWRIVRNAADHGNFTEYQLSDVSAMVSGVRDLLSQHLG